MGEEEGESVNEITGPRENELGGIGRSSEPRVRLDDQGDLVVYRIRKERQDLHGITLFHTKIWAANMKRL